MLSKLLSFIFKGDVEIIKTVIHKSLKIFIVQIAGVFLLFLANWLIVKNSSEEIYGMYSIIINWFVIVVVISQLGMDDFHVANLPLLKVRNAQPVMQKILNWSCWMVSLSSLLMMLTVFIIVNYLPIPSLNRYNVYFNTGILIILLQALLGNLVSFLRGMDHVVESQVADKIVRPILLLSMLFLLSRNISFNTIILSQVISLAATILLTFFLVKRLLKKDDTNTSPGFDRSLKTNFYFLIITLLHLLATRLDILVLSFFAIPEQVGHYNIAMKFADMAAYPLFIINLVIPGYLAKHHFNEDKKHLFKFMRHATRASFLGVAILLLMLLAVGIPVLEIFGKNFGNAYPALIILVCSYLISTFKSPVNGLFIVGGKERTAMWCLFLNVVVTAIFCFVLIPEYSIKGAALAILFGNVFHTILLLGLFYKQEKVLITPFAIFNGSEEENKK